MDTVKPTTEVIEVETCLQFLYLRRGKDEVYIGYDLDGFRGLLADAGDHGHLEIDPKGDKHLLIISPQLVGLSDTKARLALGYDLVRAYARTCA
jgi:hypothetical protein